MKEQIAADHHAVQEDRYGRLTPRAERHAAVVGCNPGNIGHHIADSLSELFPVTMYDRSPVLGADVNRLDAMEGAPNGGWNGSWEPFDTLVLANGYTNLAWLEDQDELYIHRAVNDNLLASMLATKRFVRDTKFKPWLKYIVYVGSMAYRNVLNGSAPYCAAKAGLNMFARCAAWELAPKGYRVFIVHPSNTEGTPMTEKTIQGLMRYRNLDREEAEAYWGAVRALPAWLQPWDIGRIVQWLVTDVSAEFLTGNPLDLAGSTR